MSQGDPLSGGFETRPYKRYLGAYQKKNEPMVEEI
jgi:hypothetical protein